jgi:signal peptidase I
MAGCERSRRQDPLLPCTGGYRVSPRGRFWAVLRTAAAVATGSAVLVLAARHRLLLVDVVGNSMSPTYRHGDRLLVLRRRRFRTGQVVIAIRRAPDRAPGGSPWLVKRLAAMPGETTPASVVPAAGGRETVPVHAVVLLGDSAASVDSRSVGFVPLADLGGVVLGRTRAANGRADTP